MDPILIASLLFVMFPVAIVVFGFAHLRMSISMTDEHADPDRSVTTIFRWLATTTLFGFWLFTYSVLMFFSDNTLAGFLITAALAIRSVPIAKRLFRFGSTLAEHQIEIERAIQ